MEKIKKSINLKRFQERLIDRQRYYIPSRAFQKLVRQGRERAEVRPILDIAYRAVSGGYEFVRDRETLDRVESDIRAYGMVISTGGHLGFFGSGRVVRKSILEDGLSPFQEAAYRNWEDSRID